MKKPTIDVASYSRAALPNLEASLEKNKKTLETLADLLYSDVKAGKSLLVFGSGHSALFPMELYHRAGGASFVIPVVADYLLPIAGPPVVRALERTPGVAGAILGRASPRPGEMLWIASQSGINGAVVDLAEDARKRGLKTVAFTSVAHSQSAKSRHPSGKRLFEACDLVVDLCGVPGDAAVEIASGVRAGPLSTLTSVFLAHSIMTAAVARLEADGFRCVFSSVNTGDGESRNRALEERARERDPLLRE